MNRALKEFILGSIGGMAIVIGAFIGVSQLSGCSTMPIGSVDSAQAAVIACSTATQAIAYATENADKMTKAERDSINASIETVRPICDQPTPPKSLTQAQYDLLNGAAAAMTQLGGAHP